MRDQDYEKRNEPAPLDFPLPVLELQLASLRWSGSLTEDNKRYKARHRRHVTVVIPKEGEIRKQRRKDETI